MPIAAVVMSLAAPGAASAAPGALDARYDGDGMSQVVGTGALLSIATTSVAQGDGGMLVGGARTSIGLDLDDDFAFDFRVHPTLTKYRADGTVDADYGDRGVAKLYLQNHLSIVTALAPQADGSTLVAGVDAGILSLSTFLARVDARGRLDTSFGHDGYVTSLPEDLALLAPLAVHALPDGRITTAGIGFGGDLFGFGDRKRRADVDLVLQRYQPTGVPDRSYGDQGRVNVDTNGTDSLDVPMVARFDADGSLQVGGVAVNDALTYGRSLLLRLDGAGSLDRSFGSTGIVMGAARRDRYDAVTAMDVVGDGSILHAVSHLSDDESSGVHLARVDRSGASRAFDGASRSIVRIPEMQVAADVMRTADGRVLIAGAAFDDGGDIFVEPGVVAQVLPGGRVDTRFERGGLARFEPADDELRISIPSALHEGPDGTILVTGTFEGRSGVARLYGASAAGAGMRRTSATLRVTRVRGGAGCGSSARRPCILDARRPGKLQLRVATRGVPTGTMVTIVRSHNDWGWGEARRYRVPVRRGGVAVLDVTRLRIADAYVDEEDGDFLDHRFRVVVPATAESVSARSSGYYVRVAHPFDAPESDDNDTDFDFSRARACGGGSGPIEAGASVACRQVDASRAVRGDTRAKLRRWLGR